MPKKVLITSKYFVIASNEAQQMLENAGFEVVYPEETPRILKEDELIKWGSDVDAIIASSDNYTEDILNQLPQLKTIARVGVGCDCIDMEAATRKGVVVTITPDTNNESVADMAMGLMMAVTRGIVNYHTNVREGLWQGQGKLGMEITNKTLGIIGLGKIGRSVAKRARGFGMRILGYDSIVRAEEVVDEGIEMVSLEKLLQQSDVITLHVPHTKETHHLIGQAELAQMKPHAYLINTARGGVIDQDALYEALVQEKIAGAGLDVFQVEPPSDHPLLHLPNVVLTPHIAGVTKESAIAMSRLAAENVIEILSGGRTPHSVNF